MFAQPTLRFLGHLVSEDGIAPAPDNVKAIREFPQQASAKQLMQFNGMVNFYYRFPPQATRMMSPLYDAVAGNSLGKSATSKPVEWTTVRVRAFQDIKKALVRAATLTHFVAGALLALTTDPLDFAVGAVLELPAKPNSYHNSGGTLPTGWAPPYNTPRPTTRRPTDSWNVSTGS